MNRKSLYTIVLLIGVVIVLSIIVYSCRSTVDPTREDYLRDDHRPPIEEAEPVVLSAYSGP
jgi:hypothetical protein